MTASAGFSSAAWVKFNRPVGQGDDALQGQAANARDRDDDGGSHLANLRTGSRVEIDQPDVSASRKVTLKKSFRRQCLATVVGTWGSAGIDYTGAFVDSSARFLEIRFPRVAGYRIELPEERLTAKFNDDSVLVLTPDVVGATEPQNSGIIGANVDLTLVHTGDVRPSQILYELTSHLVLTKWRDPGWSPARSA
jgi:hypothetical protein